MCVGGYCSDWKASISSDSNIPNDPCSFMAPPNLFRISKRKNKLQASQSDCTVGASRRKDTLQEKIVMIKKKEPQNLPNIFRMPEAFFLIKATMGDVELKYL